jgi:hypothetical protein
MVTSRGSNRVRLVVRKGLGSPIERAKKPARVPVLDCPVVLLPLQNLDSVKDVSLAI